MTDIPAARGYGRRVALGTLAFAAVGAPMMLGHVASAGTSTAPASAVQPEPKAAQLVWSPVPDRDGLGAFEGLEDDRSHSHPGTQHIHVSDGVYRWDMHLRDRDGTDRQRHEVKGMRVDGRNLSMLKGETWRISYDMFIPDTLLGTTTFTHIFQLKQPNGAPGDGPPLVTISLQRSQDMEFLALRGVVSGVLVGRTPLAPLRNHWFTVDMTFLVDDNGRARFVVRDGGQTVLDEERGIDIWASTRIRPKWGIYRSLGDSGQLRDCHLLVRNLKAFRGA